MFGIRALCLSRAAFVPSARKRCEFSLLLTLMKLRLFLFFRQVVIVVLRNGDRFSIKSLASTGDISDAR